MILNVSIMEEGSALVQVQMIVVHPSIVTPVLVWITAQPLTLILHAMRATLFVVSRDISSVTLNFAFSFISLHVIDWLDAHHKNMPSVRYLLFSWLHTEHHWLQLCVH